MLFMTTNIGLLAEGVWQKVRLRLSPKTSTLDGTAMFSIW